MTKMLRLPQVLEATGLSQSTIWRLERSGVFPRRRRIGPNAVGWIAAEVEEFIQGLPAVETPEPDSAA